MIPICPCCGMRMFDHPWYGWVCEWRCATYERFGGPQPRWSWTAHPYRGGSFKVRHAA